MNDVYEAYLGEMLFDEQTVARRVAELGRQISDDYRGKEPLLVCILKGGVVFLVDLIKSIDIPHAIDFMAVSSYGVGARESTGAVRILMDLEQDIDGRHVVIVEDIVDSGRTLHYIHHLLQARNPASLRVCALLNKFERREVDVPLDEKRWQHVKVFVVASSEPYCEGEPMLAAALSTGRPARWPASDRGAMWSSAAHAASTSARRA